MNCLWSWCSWCISISREELKTHWMNKFIFSLCRAGKSFKTYCLVLIFCTTVFEVFKYETVRRRLVRTGLNEYELAVKLVQLVHLGKTWKHTEWINASSRQAFQDLPPCPNLLRSQIRNLLVNLYTCEFVHLYTNLYTCKNKKMVLICYTERV